MTTNISPALKKSLFRSLLLAFLGIPILAVLGFFWLEVPDSHIWQLALSLIFGAGLAIAFLWLVSAMVRSIRNTGTPCAHWLGAIILAVWMGIMRFPLSIVSHIDDHSMERAGYWNSTLSAHMRNTFTFDRLTAWQHDAAFALLWIVIPALVTPFFIETVSCGLSPRVWRVAARIVLRWQNWLAVIVCDVAVYWLTEKLTGWRPSHSVHGELISLTLRLCFCYIADFALICLLLTIDSRLLAREHARRNPGAEPVSNVS